MERISHYGSIAGSMAAILGLLWLIGEPHLRTYIDNEIELYDGKKKEENSKKVKLRTLLGEKMGIDDDEVHIEIGHQYKNEKKLHHKIDSLETIIKELQKEDKLLLKDVNANYQDILKLERKSEALNKKLDHHGLFN
jgi:hypothetical protein